MIKSLRKIGAEAFAYDEKLEQVEFPEGLETIEEWAFHSVHCLQP